ncbi:MAG: D-aminoacyl-tRNA deacylase [Pseudomonadota bacterium]
MRALIQRVAEARVDIAGETVGTIDQGLLILVCAMAEDVDADAAAISQKLAAKISKLRIFKDDEGRMNRSVLDIGGSALIVSQFTLAADTSRGNRPGFSQAAPPDKGQEIYQMFCADMAALDIQVQTGEFGADMQVHLVNDGPVTIWIDTGE